LHPKLPFEDDGEIVQWFALPAHDLSRLETHLLEMLRQPVELFKGQVCEDLDLAQIVD
jgi:hypothetical protein